MVTIKADNAALEKHLLRLADLVEEGGGGLHSDILICAENGGLSVSTSKPMDFGKELIRITRGVLLPEDQYIVKVKGDEFTLDIPAKSVLSDLQKRLIDNMITLYNLTDKVRIHRESSFMLTLMDHPEILNYLIEARNFPDKFLDWKKRVQAGMSGSVLDDFVSETYLKTRHLGYSDAVRYSNVAILMPVVDFLNHNWGGAAFNFAKGPRMGDIVVHNSQPVEENTECFAFYGAMDSLDTFLRYDFIDEGAPVVRSIPIKLDVLDYGTIDILGNFGGAGETNLTKDIADLHRFVPLANMDKEEKALKVSYLFIPDQASPLALLRVLGHLLSKFLENGFEMSVEDRKKWVHGAADQVVTANFEYYNTLLDKVAPLLGKSPDSFGLQNAKHLADVQLQKLESYKKLDFSALEKKAS